MNNMGKKLAIKGHSTCGKELLELLKMIGGRKSVLSAADIGDVLNPCVYFFYPDYPDSSSNRIVWHSLLGLERDGTASEMIIFTLEEFLEKYPFKVGDKVVDIADGDPGIITTMKWNEDVCDMGYRVAFDSGQWDWFTNDTIKFYQPENSKDIATTVNETQPKRDIYASEFMITHMMLTKTAHNVNDELEYKIIDGYEFDRVENDKIILKVVKHKYPKTWEECCEIIGINRHDVEIDLPQPYQQKMFNLFKLRICYDAYRKIAGEEIGLDKSWESPLPSLFEIVYCIRRKNNEIIKGSYRGGKSEILEFPTEEIRDMFLENFRDLIEKCKEQL